MIVCTSCKTSCNVLSHFHVIIWWLGQLCKKRVSRFLDLWRLVSLSSTCTCMLPKLLYHLALVEASTQHGRYFNLCLALFCLEEGTYMYFTVWVFLFCIPGTGLQILLSGTGPEYQTCNSTCHTCSKFKEILTFPRVIHIGYSCMQTVNCPVSGFSLRILEAGERCNVTGEYFENSPMSE